MSFLIKPVAVLSSMALSLSLVGTGSGAMAQNEGISISDP